MLLLSFVTLFPIILAYRLTNFVRDDQKPTVNTKLGTIIGSAAADGEYFEFYGIPYADSTSGSHRFKAPLPPPSFTEPFVANRNDIKCVRALGTGYEGTEDCLVANIFTSSIDPSKKMPVMVWIKGKEFDKKSEIEFSYKRFVEQDVVVVTLNFRESILGFLCLGTDVAPGNAGLKDIIAGLKWVQENIVEFGGDPDNVSLFGHGTGASAVDLITLSTAAEGLVHKAIAQSGTSFAPWAVSRNNLYHAVQVALALGHTITNIEDLSEIFTRASVPALMAAINALNLKDNSLAFSPCIERENLDGVEPLITKTPYKIISEGEYLKIPFLTGFVDNEGIIRSDKAADSEWLQQMDSQFSDFLQSDLTFKDEEEEKSISEDIKSYYFQSSPVNEKSVNEFITYTGDTMILVSTIREVQMRATSTPTVPVYLYQFSYKGTLTDSSSTGVLVETAGHGDELSYLFPDVPLISEDTDIPDTDLKITDILIERWTNFAKSGQPTADSTISEVVWKPLTKENSHFIRIINEDEVIEREQILERDLEDPYSETMSFWDEIYREHFFDARSSWVLEDRDDEDNSSGNEDDDVTTEPPVTPTTAPVTSTTAPVTPTTPPEPDSASTAVGYTFAIIAFFAVLDKFHSLVLLS